LSTTATRSKTFGWSRDLGPFFLDLSLSAGMYMELQQSTSYGRLFACAGSGRFTQVGESSLTLGLTANANASIGIVLASVRYTALSAAAKACFAVSSSYVETSCGDPRVVLSRGAELNVRFSGVRVGPLTIGAFNETWLEGTSCLE
jgi:hypothetical protein